jgi:uncharacterized protein (TIGR02246 family)
VHRTTQSSTRTRLIRAQSFIVAAVVATAGCTPANAPAPPRDAAADRQQIQAAANRIWSAVANGNAAAALAEYADDAILLGPGAAMLQGKPAITKAITETFQSVSFKDVSGKIVDIQVGGDLGVETGTYSWTIVPPSGGPMPDKGKYIHVWARSSDGAWKVNRYIINSDLPAN